MTTRVYTDRSRIQTRERCPRRLWLEYHEGPSGRGIQPSRKSVHLVVGGAVHSGLAVLLVEGQLLYSDPYQGDSISQKLNWDIVERKAVEAALADFRQSGRQIELDVSEVTAMQATTEQVAFQQAAIAQAVELGMSTEGIGTHDVTAAKSEFDRYLFAEQSALVEGLVRAYARRRLRPLLEQFEVLEVEREGSWLLSQWDAGEETTRPLPLYEPREWELWFMSRPDALLRERRTNELYIQSFKTTGQWDVRKERDIAHDMQGLSEGVEIDRRLGEWWQAVKSASIAGGGYDGPYINLRMFEFLRGLSAPPRVHAIRYEHLLKGYRSEDRELSQRLGITVYTQRSHLVRQYVATSVPKKGDGGYRIGDTCWSWDFYRPEDDKNSKLAWQNWHSRSVWDSFQFQEGGLSGGNSMKHWIDQLDASEILMSGEDSTVGLAPRVLGWKSPAQSMGVTAEHPLEAVFTPVHITYRNDDDLRDWVESIEHQERVAAQHVAEVRAATDPGERRHLMNIYFPMVRTACEYPSQCPFAREKVGVCYAGAEMKNDPLRQGAGEYVERTANHPIETQGVVVTNAATTKQT